MCCGYDVKYLASKQMLLKVRSSNIRTTLESVVLMLLLLTLKRYLPDGVGMILSPRYY